MRILVLILSLMVISITSQVYHMSLSCGTCQNKSGCQGNICMITSGDVSGEYCYGQSTCDGFGIQASISLGQCVSDLKGNICSSGLCMSSGDVNTCYGNYSDFCFDGVTQQMYCQNRMLKSIMYGGIYGRRQDSFWVNITISQDCPFSSGLGTFSRCSNDVFGSYCSCCMMSSYQGMASASGSCVPPDSPIVQIKSSLNGKYGLQSMFSLLLLVVLSLTLIV